MKTDIEFLRLVVRMRQAQTKAERSRSYNALMAARKLEGDVDAACRDLQAEHDLLRVDATVPPWEQPSDG